MPELPNDELKRYYTIGEVSEIFDVSKSLIRFWENEFSFLRPHKNSKGDRRFTRENLEQLQVIYQLVKEKGFTLDGAKKEIRRQSTYLKEKEEQLERLREIRQFLSELRDEL